MSEAAYMLEFTLSRAAHTAAPSEPQAAGIWGDHRAATVRFLLTDPPADRLYRVEVCDGGGGYDVTDLLTPQDNVVTCAIPSHWTAAGIATLRLVELTVQDGEETGVYHYPPVRLQFEARQDGAAAAATPTWQAVLTEAQHTAEQAKAIAEQTQQAGAQCLRPEDYATRERGGTVKVNGWFGIDNYSGDGVLKVIPASQEEIDQKTQFWRPIVPANLIYAVRSVGDGLYAPLGGKGVVVNENEIADTIVDTTPTGVLAVYTRPCVNTTFYLTKWNGTFCEYDLIFETGDLTDGFVTVDIPREHTTYWENGAPTFESYTKYRVTVTEYGYEQSVARWAKLT